MDCVRNRRVLTLLFVAAIAGSSGCAAKWHTKYGMNERKQLLEKESIPKLISALSDDDRETRRNALHYIYRFGLDAKDAVPGVKELARHDTSAENRIYAMRTLEFISADIQDIENFWLESKGQEGDERVKSVINDLVGKTVIRITVRLPDLDQAYTIDVNLVASYRFFNGHSKIYLARDNGILPISVSVANNTTVPILIDPDTFCLFDKGGSVAVRADKATALSKQQTSIAHTALFHGGITGVSVLQAALSNAEIERYFERNILKNNQIAPRSSGGGVVYFEVPRDVKTVTGWTVRFSIVGPEGSIAYRVEHVVDGNTTISAVPGGSKG